MCHFDDAPGYVFPVDAYDMPVNEQRCLKLLLQLEHRSNNRWRAYAISEGTVLRGGKDVGT